MAESLNDIFRKDRAMGEVLDCIYIGTFDIWRDIYSNEIFATYIHEIFGTYIQVFIFPAKNSTNSIKKHKNDKKAHNAIDKYKKNIYLCNAKSENWQSWSNAFSCTKSQKVL